MEADLERLKRDRGEGEPVKLVESVGGARGVTVTGQPIEIKLGGEEESGDDSDDLPVEGGEEEDQGQGTIITRALQSTCPMCTTVMMFNTL